MYTGIQNAFVNPGPQNMSSLVDIAKQIQTAFPVRSNSPQGATIWYHFKLDHTDTVPLSFQDPGLLGNFLENHDLPRYRNITADPMIAYNALVWQYMSDGIPISKSYAIASRLFIIEHLGTLS